MNWWIIENYRELRVDCLNWTEWFESWKRVEISTARFFYALNDFSSDFFLWNCFKILALLVSNYASNNQWFINDLNVGIMKCSLKKSEAPRTPHPNRGYRKRVAKQLSSSICEWNKAFRDLRETRILLVNILKDKTCNVHVVSREL